jgi:hypothetical protein
MSPIRENQKRREMRDDGERQGLKDVTWTQYLAMPEAKAIPALS